MHRPIQNHHPFVRSKARVIHFLQSFRSCVPFPGALILIDPKLFSFGLKWCACLDYTNHFANQQITLSSKYEDASIHLSGAEKMSLPKSYASYPGVLFANEIRRSIIDCFAFFKVWENEQGFCKFKIA